MVDVQFPITLNANPSQLSKFRDSLHHYRCLGEILSKPDYLDSFTAVNRGGGGKRATEVRERVRIPIIPGHATERVFSVDPFVAPKKNTKASQGETVSPLIISPPPFPPPPSFNELRVESSWIEGISWDTFRWNGLRKSRNGGGMERNWRRVNFD